MLLSSNFCIVKNLVRIALLLTLAAGLYSCRSQRVSSGSDSKPADKNTPLSKRSDLVLKTARKYMGTPWKLGGEEKTGIDCSGLVVVAYREAGVQLPRRSIDQASAGKEVSIHKAEPGDLIFFAFSEVDKKGINHVGIVSKVNPDGSLLFLHTSRKKGVMESSLAEPHFKKAFVKVVRP